jgi:ankyrin repeat protein
VRAQYPHNASVVRLLLRKGARANPDPGAEVRNDSSALFFTVMADDVETVELLTNADSKLTPMRVLGQLPLTPMNYAVSGDGAMVECLIRHHANPNEVDFAGISMLARAVIGDRLGVARVLLGHAGGCESRRSSWHDSPSVCSLHRFWK